MKRLNIEDCIPQNEEEWAKKYIALWHRLVLERLRQWDPSTCSILVAPYACPNNGTPTK